MTLNKHKVNLQSDLYIGLMSGTSLDGVDGVLADFSGRRLQVVAAASTAFPESLRNTLLELNSAGPNELHRAALAGNALVRCYADVTQALLHDARLNPDAVQAIGAHGQTVRHRPGAFDGIGYTLQLNQPALLAELTDIDVVADFRSRDVAAGGQGAPLVPLFHQDAFGDLPGTNAVLNIGGISNMTVLRRGEDPAQSAEPDLLGFDCGPGNALMDGWCHRHTGAPYDDGGQWAAEGEVHEALLAEFLSEGYFHQTVPKSTGRDLFNSEWLVARLANHRGLSPVDIQATLTEMTARCCADSAKRWASGSARLIVCGGGAYNRHLMGRLQALLPECAVVRSDALGLPPLQVEASAFAWLARQCILGLPGNRASVTGARGSRVLGAIYPR